LKIIVESRKYNIPFGTMLNLKDLLLGTIDIEKAIMSPEVRKAILAMAPVEKRTETEALLNDTNFIRKENVKNPIDICYLHLCILDIIVLKTHYAVLFNSEGDFVPFKESYIKDYYKVAGFTEFIHKSYVSISITEIIKSFIIGEDLELVKTQLALLTKEETEILKAIREENLISVNIRFNKDSQIDLIELTKEQYIEKESRFLDVILNNGYQEIIVKTEKGNIVRCTNTLKRKLQN
jgi:hypothetical protein